jgi:hypothetical protein
LTEKLQELGFKSLIAYVSLFIFREGDTIVFMLIYADDIIIVSSSTIATERLIQELMKDFAVKDLGPLAYFLGIEV